MHYYLQKGFAPEQILNLPFREKMFYKASMALAIDEEVQKAKAMSGGG